MITEYGVGKYKVPKLFYKLAFWIIYKKHWWPYSVTLSVHSHK